MKYYETILPHPYEKLSFSGASLFEGENNLPYSNK